MKSTSKKGLLMSILWALVLITTVVSSVVVAQSAKAAKLYLRHNVTYTAPTCIQVTFDADGGEFANGDEIIDETIKISTLSDGSIFPADEPTRSGYTFNGWEYSVNGTSYSDYGSASDMPFTDHLYVRAKWEEVSSYILTIEFGNDIETGEMSGFEIRSVDLNELNDLYSPFYFNQGLVYSYVRNNCTLIEDIASKLKGGQRNFSIEISANITTIAILLVGTGCDTIKNVSYNDGLTEEYSYFGDCKDQMMGIYSVNFAYTEHSISFPIIRLDD